MGAGEQREGAEKREGRKEGGIMNIEGDEDGRRGEGKERIERLRLVYKLSNASFLCCSDDL